MDLNSMKNTIVLKNLPSNMVDKAYVVFKDNVKIHKIDEIRKDKNKDKETKVKNKEEYMIKEAEMIIKDYISKIENKENETSWGNKRLKEKYKKLKAFSIFITMISVLSLIITIFN